jgi:diketogulonate reductase-like aldo/keto reductase
MPGIIYGTAWKKDRTRDLVVRAVRAGFRGIDTACQPKHYNEPQVGEALVRLADDGIGRNEIFLQTKFTPLAGQDPATVPYDPAAPPADQVAQSFAVSLENLRTDVIDSLVLHSPLAPHTLLMEVWGAMEEIAESGGARQLGISNCYDLPVLEALCGDARVKPAVVQNRFYIDSGYDQELREWCSTRGIGYQSFWTLTANPHSPPTRTCWPAHRCGSWPEPTGRPNPRSSSAISPRSASPRSPAPARTGTWRRTWISSPSN